MVPPGLEPLTLGWEFNCCLQGHRLRVSYGHREGPRTTALLCSEDELSVCAVSELRACTVLGPPQSTAGGCDPQNVPYPESCLILLGFVSSLLAVRMMLRYLRS